MARAWTWAEVWASVQNVQKSPESNRPRIPTDEEYSQWVNSSPEGARPQDIRAYLQHLDSRRWKRIQKDLKWVEKQLKILGMNPEEGRWYL
jgi:hypothetical protein